jgi:hypothetical protein
MINGCILYIDNFFNLASGNTNNMLHETIEKIAEKNYKTIIDWHLCGSFGKSYLIFDSKDKK